MRAAISWRGDFVTPAIDKLVLDKLVDRKTATSLINGTRGRGAVIEGPDNQVMFLAQVLIEFAKPTQFAMRKAQNHEPTDLNLAT